MTNTPGKKRNVKFTGPSRASASSKYSRSASSPSFENAPSSNEPKKYAKFVAFVDLPIGRDSNGNVVMPDLKTKVLRGDYADKVVPKESTSLILDGYACPSTWRTIDMGELDPLTAYEFPDLAINVARIGYAENPERPGRRRTFVSGPLKDPKAFGNKA